MRLGWGSQFPLILGLCGIVGGSSAACGGVLDVSAAVVADGTVSVSPCADETRTSSYVVVHGEHGGRGILGPSDSGVSPSSSSTVFSLRDSHRAFPLSSYGIHLFVPNACAHGRCPQGSQVALTKRRDARIAGKAWMPLPTNNMPGRDETWMSPPAGLCTCECLLPHATLARGPPREPGENT